MSDEESGLDYLTAVIQMAHQADLAYCAGVLDLSGEIGMSRDIRRHQMPYVRIRRLEQGPLAFLAKTLGSQVRQIHSGKRVLYEWHVRGRTAQKVMIAVRPWLKVRAKEVDELMAWVPLRGGPVRRQDLEARA